MSHLKLWLLLLRSFPQAAWAERVHCRTSWFSLLGPLGVHVNRLDQPHCPREQCGLCSFSGTFRDSGPRLFFPRHICGSQQKQIWKWYVDSHIDIIATFHLYWSVSICGICHRLSLSLAHTLVCIEVPNTWLINLITCIAYWTYKILYLHDPNIKSGTNRSTTVVPCALLNSYSYRFT